jgi:hypothetical protein
MSAEKDGIVPFDLLVEGRFKDVIERLGQGRGYSVVSAKMLAKPRSFHTPPPDKLVGALQDSVHKDVGLGKAARSIKSKTK